jgi:hypothetical protein
VQRSESLLVNDGPGTVGRSTNARLAATKGRADRSLLDAEGHGNEGGNVDFTLDFWSETSGARHSPACCGVIVSPRF